MNTNRQSRDLTPLIGQMNAVKRAGVVEIGSRAIRLLVAEISPAGRLATVTSDWRETGLAKAQSIGGIALDQKVDEIIGIVNAFQEESRRRQANRLCVFATEAVRSMSTEHTAILRERIPGLQVIERKTEACCSLLGAITPFETPKPTDEAFVIDQGAGSMELAVGRISTSGVELSQYKGYKLGTQELVEDFSESRNDFGKFRLKLEQKVNTLKILDVAPKLRPIVLGSAATKMAWIKVRRNPADRYEPGKVHGHAIELSAIDKLVTMAATEPQAVRKLVDPLNPNSHEFETVMTGLIAISAFLKRLEKNEFRVSAYGPRYGVVWMTAVYRTLGFDITA